MVVVVVDVDVALVVMITVSRLVFWREMARLLRAMQGVSTGCRGRRVPHGYGGISHS